MVCPYNDGYGLSISESNKFPLKEKLGSPPPAFGPLQAGEVKYLRISVY